MKKKAEQGEVILPLPQIQPMEIGIEKTNTEIALQNIMKEFEEKTGKRISRVEIYRDNNDQIADIKTRIER